jgi:RNA polymerase sigma-70 factor (ECF subfamily)
MARSRPSLLLRAQPDARLLGLFRAGDEGAFEEMVRRYRPRLVDHAARIAGDGEADDVVQESLAIAYHALQHTEVLALWPWLYAVVRNRALTDLGARRRLAEPLSDEVAGLDDPSHTADRRATLASLIDQLRAMPHGQRAALVKHEFEGLDYRRVAHDLDMTPGAAKQLVYRARCRLRRAAGALVPSGLLHALGSQGTDATTGAVGALLKGGIATGVLASAVAVGAGARDDAPRQRQAQAVPVVARRTSRPVRAAAPAPVAVPPRTLAAATVRVPVTHSVTARPRMVDVSIRTPAATTVATPVAHRSPWSSAERTPQPSRAPADPSQANPSGPPPQSGARDAAPAKAGAACPPQGDSHPAQQGQGEPQ